MIHSTPSSLSTLVAIPELALMLSDHLSQRDYCQLCLTCKSFHQVFQPLVWHDFDYNDYDYKYNQRSYLSLAKNLVHVRNLIVVLEGEPYYNYSSCVIPVYGLLCGLDAQANALQERELDREEPDIEKVDIISIMNTNSNNNINNDNSDHNINSNERQCTNLRQFDFTMDTTNDSWNPCDVREYETKLFLEDVMRLNIYLTDLSLHTRLVIEFDDDFLKAFMSLNRLQSLTISVSEADEPTHPRALKMLTQLSQHHPSLRSIDFGGVSGGWRPCIAFRPDHMTEEDHAELDRQDEKDEQEEDELIKTLAEQFKKTPSSDSGITFPRIHRLELPPRQYKPYPESFLKALHREGVVPNLCSLVAPQGVRYGE